MRRGKREREKTGERERESVGREIKRPDFERRFVVMQV